MQAFSNRVIGSLWVLSDADRQTTDRQHDARRATGVDERHRFQDQASGARDDRPGLAQALTFLQPGDGRMGWKRDRLGRPPAPPDRERERVKDGRGRLSRADRADGYYDPARGAAVSSVRGTGPVRAGADSGADPGGLGDGAAARRRGRRGGRLRVLDVERLEAVRAALGRGESTAAVCRTFGIPRSTLCDALGRGVEGRIR